jgi:hypothetical protein
LQPAAPIIGGFLPLVLFTGKKVNKGRAENDFRN